VLSETTCQLTEGYHADAAVAVHSRDVNETLRTETETRPRPRPYHFSRDRDRDRDV